ncbi:MAG TPA: PEP/pyruvate-binding domain-containing protein, partial [Casimicrobiaceae bacterium]|nr:PEP/pyruvate-binding domain-containing protein [Casimicrobiaceae bacterium]
MRPFRYVRFFAEIGIGDVAIVGGKNASLGEMYRELGSHGVRVPNGFAVVSSAYWLMLERAGVLPTMKEIISGLDPSNVDDLATRGRVLRDIVYGAGLPEDVRREIIEAYRELQDEYGASLSLAVRSS